MVNRCSEAEDRTLKRQTGQWMVDLVFSFETESYNWRQDNVDCEQVFNFGSVAVGRTLKMPIKTVWMVFCLQFLNKMV